MFIKDVVDHGFKKIKIFSMIVSASNSYEKISDFLVVCFPKMTTRQESEVSPWKSDSDDTAVLSSLGIQKSRSLSGAVRCPVCA